MGLGWLVHGISLVIVLCVGGARALCGGVLLIA